VQKTLEFQLFYYLLLHILFL